MEFPLDELIDKTTIWKLKYERIGDENSRNNYLIFQKELDKYKYEQEWFDTLYKINARMWDIEGNIRNGLDDNKGYEHIGKLAIMARDNNKERVSYRNMIVEKTGQGFKDIKVNCVSAE